MNLHKIPLSEFHRMVRLHSWRQGVSNDLRYFQVLSIQDGDRNCTALIYRDFLHLPKLKTGQWLDITLHPASTPGASHVLLTDLRHLTAKEIEHRVGLLLSGHRPNRTPSIVHSLENHHG